MNFGREVEAIEEGKIVKVSEDYALKEGLPIIRKNLSKETERFKEREEAKEKIFGADEFRKPLDWKERKEIRGLIDNFHWEILRRRRVMNLTRKQFAEAVGEKEETIRKLENGILSSQDYVLISKVQGFLGINIRRDSGNFGDMRKLVEENEDRNAKVSDKDGKENKEEKDSFLGDDIEIIE